MATGRPGVPTVVNRVGKIVSQCKPYSRDACRSANCKALVQLQKAREIKRLEGSAA